MSRDHSSTLKTYSPSFQRHLFVEGCIFGGVGFFEVFYPDSDIASFFSRVPGSIRHGLLAFHGSQWGGKPGLRTADE